MPKWHSSLAASAASRWMNCPGSIALSEGVPSPPTSVYAQEGTAAAYLAELCLTREIDAKDYLDHWITVYGWKCRIAHKKPKKNFFAVDDEMVEAVQLFLDTVREEEDGVIQAEKQIKLPHVHEVLGGTIDVLKAVPYGKLTIFDFKYGRGVVVEAVENYQLLIYLLGAEALGVYTEFEVVIVQPRAPHPEGSVRRWTVTRKRLREFAKEAKKKAIEALRKDAEIKAGDHCRWCPVSGTCAVQLKWSQSLARIEFDPINPEQVSDPALIETDRLAEILQYKDMMKVWFADIAVTLANRINLGEDVPGWKLVRGKGNRKWKSEKNAEKLLRRKGFGKLNLFTEPQLKSPAQIEKLKGAKFNTKKGLEEFVTTLTERPEREATLVRDTDKRLGFVPAHADFEDITDSNGEN